MKYTDLKTGEIFAIEGTRTYPKLKLDNGYIDIRDKIKPRSFIALADFEVEIITKEKLYEDFKERFEMSRYDVDMMLDRLATQ